MAIFKNKYKSDFTIIPNEIIRDSSLSYEHKGLIAILYSLPPNCDVSLDEIKKRTKDSEQEILMQINELIELGYLDKDLIKQGDK